MQTWMKLHKKTEKPFFEMCLRIKCCNHQRPRTTKWLKSLYPSVHPSSRPSRLQWNLDEDSSQATPCDDVEPIVMLTVERENSAKETQ